VHHCPNDLHFGFACCQKAIERMATTEPYCLLPKPSSLCSQFSISDFVEIGPALRSALLGKLAGFRALLNRGNDFGGGAVGMLLHVASR